MLSLPYEIRKDITWYESYQASTMWNIRNRKWVVINKYNQNQWYLLCNLWWKIMTIHRIIAKTFISNIDNKSDVNHIDLNKKNNCVSNLEWCTHSENVKHYMILTKKRYEIYIRVLKRRCICLFLRNEQTHINYDYPWQKAVLQYTLDWNFIKHHKSAAYAERDTWIDNRNISKCCRWKLKTACWYKWRFA